MTESLKVKVLAGHTGYCLKVVERNDGWTEDDLWFIDPRERQEYRDKIGRLHRGGTSWTVVTCALNIECPARAVVESRSLDNMVGAALNQAARR